MKMGLMQKMLLIILLPAIVGLLLVAGLSYRMSEGTLRQQIRQDILILLSNQKIGLHAVFEGVQEALSLLAENNRVNAFWTPTMRACRRRSCGPCSSGRTRPSKPLRNAIPRYPSAASWIPRA